MKLVIILSLLLSGCLSDINPWDLEQSYNLCKDHGGIHQILVDSGDVITTYCMDSTHKQLTEVK